MSISCARRRYTSVSAQFGIGIGKYCSRGSRYVSGGAEFFSSTLFHVLYVYIRGSVGLADPKSDQPASFFLSAAPTVDGYCSRGSRPARELLRILSFGEFPLCSNCIVQIRGGVWKVGDLLEVSSRSDCVWKLRRLLFSLRRIFLWILSRRTWYVCQTLTFWPLERAQDVHTTIISASNQSINNNTL